MKRSWSWMLVLVAFVTACSEKTGDSITITGRIDNLEKILPVYPAVLTNGKVTLMLFEIPFNGAQPVQLDSVSISPDQKTFTLKGKTSATGIYDVLVGGRNGPIVPLVNDADEITLNLDFTNPDKFWTVQGSPASRELRDFMFTYADKGETISRAMSSLDSMKQFGAPDTALLGGTNRKNASISDLNKYLKDFLVSVKHPIVATFALGRSLQTLGTEFEPELNKVTARFPQDVHLNELKKNYQIYKAESAKREQQEQQARENSWVGKQVPEMIMPDANGKNVSLSSFRGKYVLVDFWASWCRPCLAENPNVVYSYNKFKDKNFTILGVSLDQQKANWLQAIERQNLNWTQVSDLAYWDSEAVKIFKFSGIPFNILVDPQGLVVAENLRGEGLPAKLAEVLQ